VTVGEVLVDSSADAQVPVHDMKKEQRLPRLLFLLFYWFIFCSFIWF